MCGIWAVAGGDLQLSPLQEAAEGAYRRGPHAHGWTTVNEPGITSHRVLGPGGDCDGCAALIPGMVTARRAIGHSRLATFGDPRDERAIQPLHSGGHALVHNGNVYNWADLDPKAVSDSAALVSGYAYHRQDAGPMKALQYVINEAKQNAWAIAVLDWDGTLVVHRHRLPLYLNQDLIHGSAYLSSAPIRDGLLIPEDTIIQVAGAL